MHYDNESKHICLYMYACVHALGKEWVAATEGLLAQSAGGRDRRTEGKEGAAVRDRARTQLAGPGALEQWVVSKQQAADTEHGLTDTHILYISACFHVCAPFLFSCWCPAVPKGGSHVRGGAAKVSFLDQRLNSRDIMSFSVATLPLTAAHLPHHRNLDCGSPWQTVCLLQCVRICLLS